MPHVLSFDMGGTTAKICLLTDGEPERARKFEIARAYRDMKGSGIPVRIPVIEMVEIGAGGGSIARVDKLSRITVGPDSAGSTPGPVCYGRGGTEPAVTDANLALGKIDPAYFAGGKIALDEAAAKSALQKNIGQKLGLKDFWPAAGVTEIVEENMANAARVHAIERGHDIAACTMIAFGGGAPLHACRLAEKVGVSTIIVPMGAGVGSAIGFLRAPVAYEITKSAVVSLENFNAAARQQPARRHDGGCPRRGRARARQDEGHRPDHRGLPLRRPGPRNPRARAGEEAHRRRWRKAQGRVRAALRAGLWPAHSQPGGGSHHLVGHRLLDRRQAQARRQGRQEGSAQAALAGARIYDPALGKQVQAPVYWRFDMKPGSAIKGPAIIAEDETSTIVGANFTASINSLDTSFWSARDEQGRPGRHPHAGHVEPPHRGGRGTGAVAAAHRLRHHHPRGGRSLRRRL